jgi:hypothetical protein
VSRVHILLEDICGVFLLFSAFSFEWGRLKKIENIGTQFLLSKQMLGRKSETDATQKHKKNKSSFWSSTCNKLHFSACLCYRLKICFYDLIASLILISRFSFIFAVNEGRLDNHSAKIFRKGLRTSSLESRHLESEERGRNFSFAFIINYEINVLKRHYWIDISIHI